MLGVRAYKEVISMIWYGARLTETSVDLSIDHYVAIQLPGRNSLVVQEG
jgi:hypothetical protein